MPVISFNRDIKKCFKGRKAFPGFPSETGCRGQYSKAVAQTLSLLCCKAKVYCFLYTVPEISLILSPSPFCLCLPPHSYLRVCVFMTSHPTFSMLLLPGALHLIWIRLNYFPACLTPLYALPPPSDSYTVLKAVAL